MIHYSPFFMINVLTLMTSTIMAISSTNWLMVWLAMELNLISFIPIMNNSYSFQETEASVKYLLIQALGSSLLIMSSLSLWLSHQIFINMNLILLFSLLIKIGMAPCHLWYPSVMTSISWIPALMLSTWQKIAPLSIMSFFLMSTSTNIMMILASMNALTGGLMGLNQSHLRTLLAYSSITHMGWMMALISNNMSMSTIIYFMFYSMLITPIFMMLNKMNTKTLSQMNSSSMNVKSQYIIIPLLFLSLGGLPPLTGFFPKWFAIFLLTPNSMIMLFILIAGSLMNLYFYLNIVFSIMLSTNKNKTSWNKKTAMNFTWIMYMTFTLIPLIPLML
uniref:NADH dehydrogenase subunit 2 n=1 Tax=Enchytraeus irregularis TaxID=2867162 RepID=UPI0022FD58EB|nr:NADH dehydrogenase subunit 2 [Enchytraeus irregularis]WAS35302.1 NADH dehydrogenase subunit 2 [Enchytraeus irregularis]